MQSFIIPEAHHLRCKDTLSHNDPTEKIQHRIIKTCQISSTFETTYVRNMCEELPNMTSMWPKLLTLFFFKKKSGVYIYQGADKWSMRRISCTEEDYKEGNMNFSYKHDYWNLLSPGCAGSFAKGVSKPSDRKLGIGHTGGQTWRYGYGWIQVGSKEDNPPFLITGAPRYVNGLCFSVDILLMTLAIGRGCYRN